MSVDVAVSPHQATTDIDEFQTFPPPSHMNTQIKVNPPRILAFCIGKQIGRLTGKQL